MRVVSIYRGKKILNFDIIFIFFKKVLLYKNCVWIIGWEKKSKVICTANQKTSFKSYPDFFLKKKGNRDTPCAYTHSANVLANHFVTSGKADSNFIFSAVETLQHMSIPRRLQHFFNILIASLSTVDKVFQHPHCGWNCYNSIGRFFWILFFIYFNQSLM